MHRYPCEETECALCDTIQSRLELAGSVPDEERGAIIDRAVQDVIMSELEAWIEE